jgi:hypothetical protein
MHIKKVYETIVNLSATEMYGNIDEVVLYKLKKNFEGKCRENSLIINISEIKKRSMCKLSKSQTDGSGSVSVQYVAEAITYNSGDILPLCQIISIEKNHSILCEYDKNTVVWIKGNRNIRGLRIGQKIAIIVMNVRYGTSLGKIVVYGLPYTYPGKFIVYNTNPADVTGEDNEIITLKLEEIAKEQELYSATDSKVRQFLNDIYYPYVDKFSPADLPGETNLVELTGFALKPSPAPLLMCRPQVINKSEDAFISMTFDNYVKMRESDSILFGDRHELISESYGRAIIALLDDYLQYIHLIRELASEFSTEKNLESHNNLWNMYRHIKKETKKPTKKGKAEGESVSSSG